MLEEGVGRVISTERCAERSDGDAGRLTLRVDEGEDFVRHIGVVLRLHPAAMEGVRSFACKVIALHAMDAVDAYSPVVDIRTKRADHALSFLLLLVAD